MLRSLLKKAGMKAWPPGVPNLYPKLDEVELCSFLSNAAYKAILRFPQLIILPFASRNQNEFEQLLGIGLSRLMIRDLMLVRNLSVRGPEDTPLVFVEEARRFAKEEGRPGEAYVMGVVGFHSDGLILELEVRRRGQPTQKGKLIHGEFIPFLARCARNIARAVSGHLDQTLLDQWQVSRPSDFHSLVELGRLRRSINGERSRSRKKAIRELLEADPAFGLPGCEANAEDRSQRGLLLEAFRRDPFDAQACFGLFINIWSSSGWEPAAMQFARRAIELSPGHGKAHMCAPHAAHPSVMPSMLSHSELGYRLLPGNSFAINNYIIHLQENGASRDQLLQLANEGIASDPFDPENYERMIDMFCQVNEYANALTFALRLQTLYEPVMDRRALYCLKQNPQLARMIESGQYRPAEENRKRIAELKQAVISRHRS